MLLCACAVACPQTATGGALDCRSGVLTQVGGGRQYADLVDAFRMRFERDQGVHLRVIVSQQECVTQAGERVGARRRLMVWHGARRCE